MADAAFLRREARRKRILENSQSRLKLIAGESVRKDVTESFINSAPNDVSNVLNESDRVERSTVNSGILHSDTDLINGVPELSTLISYYSPESVNNHSEITEENEELTYFLSTPKTVKPPSVFQKLMKYKYDILLLSLIIEFLQIASFPFENINIFIPLIIYTFTKHMCLPSQSKFQIAGLLVLLSGIPKKHVDKIMFFVNCVSELSEDICVYLFSTVCIKSLRIAIMNVLT